MRGRRCSRFAVFPMGKAVLSFSALETHFPTLFHTVRALSAPSGHLPHWEGKANSRSFKATCVSNECVFAGSWRDVPYKYAALRVLTQCTTSLKAGMSDRAPLRFPPLSFIRLEPYPARFARHLPHAGKALMRGRRCSRFAVFPMGKAVLSFSALETHFPTLFHTASSLSAATGHLPGGADDTRETCHRRPSGIARFILR